MYLVELSVVVLSMFAFSRGFMPHADWAKIFCKVLHKQPGSQRSESLNTQGEQQLGE